MNYADSDLRVNQLQVIRYETTPSESDANCNSELISTTIFDGLGAEFQTGVSLPTSGPKSVH